MNICAYSILLHSFIVEASISYVEIWVENTLRYLLLNQLVSNSSMGRMQMAPSTNVKYTHLVFYS